MLVFNEAFEYEILQREKEFSSYSAVNAYVVTWNLGGYTPPPNLDIRNLFNFGIKPTPDVIVVGFQEYVKLKAANLVSKAAWAFSQSIMDNSHLKDSKPFRYIHDCGSKRFSWVVSSRVCQERDEYKNYAC